MLNLVLLNSRGHDQLFLLLLLLFLNSLRLVLVLLVLLLYLLLVGGGGSGCNGTQMVLDILDSRCSCSIRSSLEDLKSIAGVGVSCRLLRGIWRCRGIGWRVGLMIRRLLLVLWLRFLIGQRR